MIEPFSSRAIQAYCLFTGKDTSVLSLTNTATADNPKFLKMQLA
jgi:hypothetical protein